MCVGVVFTRSKHLDYLHRLLSLSMTKTVPKFPVFKNGDKFILVGLLQSSIV